MCQSVVKPQVLTYDAASQGDGTCVICQGQFCVQEEADVAAVPPIHRAI